MAAASLGQVYRGLTRPDVPTYRVSHKLDGFGGAHFSGHPLEPAVLLLLITPERFVGAPVARRRSGFEASPTQHFLVPSF